MKTKYTEVIILLLVSIYGCKSPTDNTYEDLFRSNDSTYTSDTLSGNIIYSTSTYGIEGYESSTITLLNLKDYSKRKLKSYGWSRVYDLALLPDSNILVYNREENYSHSKYFIRINITSPDSSEVAISSNDSVSYPHCASWTSNNKLAYLVNELGIWKLIIDGEVINIDRNIVGDKIVFTKDGQGMIYSSLDDSFHISLYNYDLTNQTSELLVKADTSEQIARIYYPSLSDDGRLLFVKSFNGNKSDELWVVNKDKSNLRKISSLDGSLLESKPVWSPDGKKIAFISYHQIYIMNDDGTNKKKLISSTADEILWFK